METDQPIQKEKDKLRSCRYDLNEGRGDNQPIWIEGCYFHLWFKKIDSRGNEIVQGLIEDKNGKMTGRTYAWIEFTDR